MCPQPAASLIIHTSSTRFRPDAYASFTATGTGLGFAEANGFALYETPAVRDRNTQSELKVDKGGGVDLVRDGLFGAGALAEPVLGEELGRETECALGQDALRRSLTNVPPSGERRVSQPEAL